MLTVLTCFTRDLKGNNLECDCKLKWLVEWMRTTNATVDQISCSGPPLFQGKLINDLVPGSFDCITAGDWCNYYFTPWNVNLLNYCCLVKFSTVAI